MKSHPSRFRITNGSISMHLIEYDAYHKVLSLGHGILKT